MNVSGMQCFEVQLFIREVSHPYSPNHPPLHREVSSLNEMKQ